MVVEEQKRNCTDEEAFTWMNSMVPAVESIHGVNIYGIVLTSTGRLPRGANGLVQVHEMKQHFLEGLLHPVNLLMCPHQCITNLPQPKAHTSEFRPMWGQSSGGFYITRPDIMTYQCVQTNVGGGGGGQWWSLHNYNLSKLSWRGKNRE